MNPYLQSRPWIACLIAAVFFLVIQFQAGAVARISPSNSSKGQAKRFSRYNELPITAIRPGGWLKQYLINQRDGLTGHLDEIGYPFNIGAWSQAKCDSIRPNAELWYPYEQNGYWVDGMVRCGYLLQDKFLINKALIRIRYVLDHPAQDGYLGPEFMRASKQGDRWAHAVFFRALKAYYSATGDYRIVKAVERHYLNSSFPYTGIRESINIEDMLWVYDATGNRKLLHLAEAIYANANKINAGSETVPASFLKDQPSWEHGVTFNERAKLGAMLYMYTGKPAYLSSSVAAYLKLNKYHMMPDGVNVSSEGLRKIRVMEVHETCDIADYTWSNGYLLMATGRATYADQIERACLNAAPSVVTKDFKALQYFSSANQTIVTNNSSHSLYEGGSKSMQYAPNAFTECCPANVNRIMPDYITRMWMTNQKRGLVAAFYGPSTVSCRVGPTETKISIEENTSYPFEGRVEFLFHTSKTVRFPFQLRIPGWCKGASIWINNKRYTGNLTSASFVTLERTFCDGDKIVLQLPQSVHISAWPDNGLAVERGPLLYALKIMENWKIDTTDKASTPNLPAYNLYPASDWNYGLSQDTVKLKREIKVIFHKDSPDPWSVDSAPIELRIPAKKINSWKLTRQSEIETEKWYSQTDQKGSLEWKFDPKYKVKGDIVRTPELPDATERKSTDNEATEIVTLVPYGCTKLRITIFPALPR